MTCRARVTCSVLNMSGMDNSIAQIAPLKQRARANRPVREGLSAEGHAIWLHVVADGCRRSHVAGLRHMERGRSICNPFAFEASEHAFHLAKLRAAIPG